MQPFSVQLDFEWQTEKISRIQPLAPSRRNEGAVTQFGARRKPLTTKGTKDHEVIPIEGSSCDFVFFVVLIYFRLKPPMKSLCMTD
jgi:hypothetical protein